MYLKHFAKYTLLCLIAEFVILFLLWPSTPHIGIIFGIPKANFLILDFLIKILPFIFLFTIIFFNQANDAPFHPFLTGLAILLVTEVVCWVLTGFILIKIVLLLFLYLVVTSTTLFLKNRKQQQLDRTTDFISLEKNNESFYFPISIFKLCVMHFITFGWYKCYWWYQNWRYIKLRDNNKSYPFLRCIFPVFFYDNFLDEINQTNRAHKIAGIKYTDLLTDYYIFILVGFIAISLLSSIYNSLILHTSRYIVANLLSTIFLMMVIVIFIPPQLAINRLNRSLNMGINKKISNLDAILIIFGIFVWLGLGTYWTLVYRSDARNATVLYDHGFYSLAYKKALSASEDGDVKSQYLLGQMYLLGKGTDQDSQQGVEWLKKSAHQGNIDAQYILGIVYHEGAQSIIRDDKKSAKWYQKAVAGGHIYATNNLAILYDHGWGVEKNPEKAMTLFKQAAAEGDSSAMYNIGLSYSKSSSAHDLTLAADWFKKSIKTEPNPCALNDLAILYAQGKGVTQDLDQAKKLFKEAGSRVLLENGDEIFTDTSFTKAKFDEYVAAFVQKQLNQTMNSHAKLEKNYPPDTIKTAKKISRKLVKMCWE